MRPLTLAAAALLALFHYALWFGNGGLLASWNLKREIAAQQEENRALAERNQALAAKVIDLKQGLDAIEERARIELGMVKSEETFYQIIDAPGRR